MKEEKATKAKISSKQFLATDKSPATVCAEGELIKQVLNNLSNTIVCLLSV